MRTKPDRQIIRLRPEGPEETTRAVVEEFQLDLRVNGRELATLICSPHQLNFLLAGFFYLQGFINTLEDIVSMGISRTSGLAELQIRGEVPEQLRPILTSGCGSGVAFNLPLGQTVTAPERPWEVQTLRQAMSRLQDRAERYRDHGGIHSAAVGDAEGLRLYAEDIGRHNTIDRLAGEALYGDMDMRGKLLVTSGRISSEMVAKAVRLGIGLLASRTSPTDRAIELCRQAGITLVGYLRGQNMEIYTHPQHVRLPEG